MNTIQQTEQELIEEFQLFDSWEDKYSYLIDLGKELPALPEEFKTEENRVTGCQSRVWLYPSFQEGKILYRGDSDAAIVRGLVALVLRVYSGRTPQEIIETEPTFLAAIGLDSHLSPNRANGFVSMIKKLKLYAIACTAPSQLHN